MVLSYQDAHGPELVCGMFFSLDERVDSGDKEGEKMSDKYTTEELIDHLEQAKSMLTYYPNVERCVAIIARLHAADALCKAAKGFYGLFIWLSNDQHDEVNLAFNALRKAAKDYEGEEK